MVTADPTEEVVAATGKYVRIDGDLNDPNVALVKAYEAALEKQQPHLKRKGISTRVARVKRMLRWAQVNNRAVATRDQMEATVGAYLESSVHAEISKSTISAYRTTLKGFKRSVSPSEVAASRGAG